MRLRWSEPAVRDFINISDFILEQNGHEAARRIALRIHEGLDSLLVFPGKGRPGRKQGTREFMISGLPWIAVYRVNQDVIEIARILHGAQRFPD